MKCTFFVCAALLMVCGCSAESEPLLPIRQQMLSSPEKVVKPLATIGGKPVSVGAFEAFWREHPELDASQSWDAFVVQELAAARMFERQPTALASGWMNDAHKRGLSRAWLAEEVEKLTWKDLTPAELAQLRGTVHTSLSRPEGLRASHLLVLVPKGRFDSSKQANVELSEAQRDALMLKAKAFAQSIEPSLPVAPDVQALEAARLRLLEQARALGLDLVVNANMKFPIQSRVIQMPKGWFTVVPAFVNGAQTTLNERGLGKRSGPIESIFGLHFIVVHEQFKAQNPSDEQVQRVVQQRGTIQARTRGSEKSTSALVDRTPRDIFSDQLEKPSYTQEP